MTEDGGESAEAPAVDAGDGGDGEPDRTAVPVRLVMPDRWLEQVEELPLSAPVEQAKRVGLRRMLQRDTDDPDDFYVEYAERQVPDESITLDELGVEAGDVLSIRAYDLGHYPRFRG
ncbi:MAG: hypothetical protein ACOC83_05655 [Gemmatimonadota bacterium]